jgi:4,5-dihydroxyphthalate decarboxylase
LPVLQGSLGRYPHTTPLLNGPLALAGAELGFAEGFSGAAFRALPVFLTRRFPQPMIVVAARSGVRAPADLEGRRVGIGYYGNSDTAWVQVMLGEQFGVDCGRITWVAAQEPQVPRPVPPNVTQLGRAPRSAATDALPSPALGAMLAAGELAAVVYGVPRWDTAHPDLAPLLDPAGRFVDDWVASTGTFPPLHTLVIANRVIEAYPGLPAALFTALDAARRAALDDPGGGLAGRGGTAPDPALVAAGAQAGFPRLDRANVHPGLAPEPFPYGLAANRPGLELLGRHAVRLGLLDRQPDLGAAFLDVTG